MQLLQWLFRVKVGQEGEEISSSTNKKATTNDQEVKPNYVIVFRRGSVGVYRKSKGVEESKLGSKKFKPFTFLCRKDVATACFYSTLQLKRLSSINRRQARQHWIQSMKIMKKEDFAGGLGISSTKADLANVGNKVLPVTDSTLSTSTSTNEQCGTSEKKETLKGDRTKTLSRMKELLRWAAAAKSEKGRTQCTRLPLYAGSGRGECRLALPPFMKRLFPSLEPETYRSWAKALAIAPSATSCCKIRKGWKILARKIMQFRNRATLKAVAYDDRLSNDLPKISFRWDLESCSTTSSAYTALSTASSLKNDQIISLPSLNSTKFQHLDDLEPKKGNWITSDSECVVSA